MAGFKGKASQASTQTQNKPKNVTLLDIRTVETKSGKKTKVQFAKGVTIQFNGETIDLGEYNSAFLKDRAEMEKDLEFLLEKGYIDEDKANEEADRIEEKGISFVLKTKLS
jgi:hypothetical protein